MSIKIVYNGAEIIEPGAYSKFEIIEKGGAPLGSTGTVAIIGESEGGEPGVVDVITRSQFDSAVKRYKSGPIADAIGILKSPSKDGRITSGASKIVIYKVNSSTKAEIDLAVAKITSKNYGVDENNISVLLVSGAIEDEQASITGTIDADFSITAGDTLILRIDGVNYTYTAPATVAAQTAADAAIALNNAPDWAPSLPILAEAEADRVKISVLDSVASLDASYISVDVASTLDTIYGIAGTARGKKGSRIITAKKGFTSESSKDLGGVAAISVQYTGAGAECLMSVKKVGGKLSFVTDTGVPADDLSIELEDSDGLPTLSFADLVALLEANAVYTASVLDSAIAPKNAVELDFYTDLKIKDVAGELHRDMYLLDNDINTRSELISMDRKEVAGAIEIIDPQQFLTGGTYGSSATSDYLAGFNAIGGVRVNIAVPLLSEDKAGISIDSVNAIANNYAAEGWTTFGKSERNVYLSKLGDKETVKEAAKSLQSQYASMLAQDIQVLSANGELKWMDPWAHACVYAGMQAGGDVGEPTTFKIVNINDLRVRDNSWDPRIDSFEMIEAGVSVTRELDAGGFQIVVANTTYGVDSNFMYNRTNVMEAGGFILYDLRFNLEMTFTGTKARTGGATEVKNFVKDRMEVYLDADITVGNDNNDFLGYRDLEVIEDGNKTVVKVIITVVEGRDFILPDIVFERNRQTA